MSEKLQSKEYIERFIKEVQKDNSDLSDSNLMQKFINIKEGLEKYGDWADKINKRARNGMPE